MPADRSHLPAIGPDPAFIFPVVLRHRLPNGLHVRTAEHVSVPVVTFVLHVEGGLAADPFGREGLAGLTADMVDEGTGTLSAIDVSDALARLGAEYEAEVGADATIFTLTTLSRFAERGGALLADLMIRPSLRETDFDRVRQLRLDRLRQLKDVPPAVAERALLRLLYGDHPYGHLAIGTDPALRALQLDQVAAFHAAMFRPSRATLIVVGARSHAELLTLAADAFGAWTEPADSPPPSASVDPPLSATRLAVVPREGAAQSELRIGHLSARRDTPDYPALLVMNAVLGGQFVSRINLRLREEKGYTYGARTGFDWRRGSAPFLVQASVHTASTADAIRDSLIELEGIRGAKPPSDSEMSLARASITCGYPRNFETAYQVARAVAMLVLYDLPDSYFEEFMARVQAVTAADVIAAAGRHVDPSRALTLIVGDHAAIAESLRSLGLGEPVMIPAA